MYLIYILLGHKNNKIKGWKRIELTSSLLHNHTCSRTTPIHDHTCCLLIMAEQDKSKSDSSRKSPAKTKGSLLRHKARSPGESMKESERSLYKLLEDFEDGKLSAFGNKCFI